MKIFLIALAALSIGLTVQAQQKQKKSGAIQFDSTFDPAAAMEANGIKLTDQMLARIPKSSKSNFELLFNATNASYMRADEFEDSNGDGGGASGAGMMRFGGMGANSNREYYYGFADNILTEVFELNDTTYFLQSKLGSVPQFTMGNNQNNPPKIEVVKSDDTKKILGLNCNKAIIKTTRRIKFLNEDKEIIDKTSIWYTNELGFNFSPNPSLWTEGAVLAIEGRGINIVAKNIEYRSVSSKDVNLPKKGMPITLEEYRAKMENMRKKMRGNRTSTAGAGQVRMMQTN